MNVVIFSTDGFPLENKMRAHPKTLFVGARGGLIGRGGCTVKLYPQSRMLVLILAARAGEMVSTDTIINLLYGHRRDGGPEQADNVVKQLIIDGRFAFAALGFSLSTIWGRGYLLEAVD